MTDHTWHQQIDEHDIGTMTALEQIDRVGAVRGELDGIAVHLKHVGEGAADLDVVIDYEDVAGHLLSVLLSTRTATVCDNFSRQRARARVPFRHTS